MNTKMNRKTRSVIAEMASRRLLDTRRLFYFIHVARAGSFTAAEAQLDVAQSTMTRQIQQLETEIGVQLLERTGRGVLLTDGGEILLRHAESILGEMSDAVDEIDRSRRRPAGELAVAAPPVFSMLFMPEVIRRVLKMFPDLRLTVLEGSTGQVHEHLAAGEVDVAVLVIAPKSQKVLVKKVSTEPLCLIVHESHPLAAARSVEREALVRLEIIVPAALHGSRTLIEDYFHDGGLAFDAHLYVDSLPVTKALIGQGHRFCSILPERACKAEIRDGTFKAIPLTPALSRSLYVARLRERPSTPYVKVLSAEIEAVLREQLPARRRGTKGD